MANVNFYGHNKETFSCRVVTHKNDAGKISYWLEFKYGNDTFTVWPSEAETIDGITAKLARMCNEHAEALYAAVVESGGKADSLPDQHPGVDDHPQHFDLGGEG